MKTLNPDNHRAIHTVIGAGQIGRRLARLLGEANFTVRLIRRGAPGEAMPKVTWLQGDITDPAFADRALAGSQVVYNCTNPSDYHRWDGVIQPLFRAIYQATARAGANLVVLDNLYMYGRTNGEAMVESQDMRPCSRKGALRREMTRELLQAQERGELRVAIGRASDFFGPGTANSIYGDRLLEAIESGKAIETFGDLDLPRSYSYAPDVAKGLAVLGTRPEAMGEIWHLPVSAQSTTRGLLDAIATAYGRPLKTRHVPRWVLRAMGLLMPTLGAMAEMLYQWEEAFVVDDARFREVFGVEATPLEEAAAETVREWVQRNSKNTFASRSEITDSLAT